SCGVGGVALGHVHLRVELGPEPLEVLLLAPHRRRSGALHRLLGGLLGAADGFLSGSGRLVAGLLEALLCVASGAPGAIGGLLGGLGPGERVGLGLLGSTGGQVGLVEQRLDGPVAAAVGAGTAVAAGTVTARGPKDPGEGLGGGAGQVA